METGTTQKELDRVAVLALRRSGQIPQTEAANRLGVSERQVRRLERRIAAHLGRAGHYGRPFEHETAFFRPEEGDLDAKRRAFYEFPQNRTFLTCHTAAFGEHWGARLTVRPGPESQQQVTRPVTKSSTSQISVQFVTLHAQSSLIRTPNML
jgi:hypothetical protein